MSLYTDMPLSEEVKTNVASRLVEHIEHRTTDCAPGTLEVDRRAYFDPEVARGERDGIFSSVPIIAAHGSELPLPNDYVVAQLPNNEVIVTRQSDGSVKAFVNTCRHRGAQLAMEPKGSTRLFACRYHGWTYDADGKLRSILGGAEDFGIGDTSCMGLVELPAEERHGIVWVVDNPDAEIDVAEWLGSEMEASLAPFELDSYQLYRVGTFDERINWKALMDAFLDAYHIASAHRGTVAPYFYNNVQLWEPLGPRHGRAFSPRKSIDTVRHLPPAEIPIDRHVTLVHFFMPNMSLLRQPDHLELLNFTPHPTDPTATRMQMRILVKEAPTSDADRARWDKNWDILMAVLRDEDLVVNTALQKSVANRHAAKLVFGRNEIVNQHFHNWLQRAEDDPRHWG